MSEVAVTSQNCGSEVPGKPNNLISDSEMETENEIEEQPRKAKRPRTDDNESIASTVEKVLSEKLDSRISAMEKLIKSSISTHANKISDLEHSYSDLQYKYNNLQIKYDNLYKKVNEKNVIIYGLDDENENEQYLTTKIESFLQSVLHREIKTDDVYRMGKYFTDQCRPVCVTLFSLRDKKAILLHREQFKQVQETCQIKSDLPKTMRIAHKLLINKRHELQETGKDGVICFNNYTIRTTDGTIFNVVEDKLIPKTTTTHPINYNEPTSIVPEIETGTSQVHNRPLQIIREETEVAPFGITSYFMRPSTTAQRLSQNFNNGRGTNGARGGSSSTWKSPNGQGWAAGFGDSHGGTNGEGGSGGRGGSYVRGGNRGRGSANLRGVASGRGLPRGRGVAGGRGLPRGRGAAAGRGRGGGRGDQHY